MPIYYYSFDSYGGKFEENATIKTIEASCFESFRDKLLALAQSEGFDPEFKQEVVQGYWGDCWFKSYSDLPSTEWLLNMEKYWDIQPFTPEQLYIRKPGTHPGGNCYWINPSEPVYAVRYAPEES